MPKHRIALIHAVREAIAPIHDALARVWPDAEPYDLLDESLSRDRAAGTDAAALTARFIALGRYAAQARSPAQGTDGILFTCSAFGPQIDAVRRDLAIAVVKPNEGAFREALAHGRSIALLVTFEPSLAPLLAELHEMAAAQGHEVEVEARVVPEAFAALRSGEAARHDALVAAAAGALRGADAFVLGQFSTARARDAVAKVVDAPVVTTPESAVRDLRARLAGG